MMEAAYYTLEGKDARCNLCPHQCLISQGKTGICKVRRLKENMLIAETYGRVSSLHFDPIEKKPLYHFYPGSHILSVGSVGCNLRCSFCQNHQISQCGIDDLPLISKMDPGSLAEKVSNTVDNIGLAFTYNEPVIWFEFIRDTAKLIKERGLKNVMITNGFIQPEPLRDLLPLIDAFNVDLKAFSDSFYRSRTLSSLFPVLESIKTIYHAGKHLEITFLIIPNLNDSTQAFEDMLNWITAELGPEVPMHLSRYFPMHRLNHPPTPLHTLENFHNMASSSMHHVYLGNVSYLEIGHDTICPSCRELVIQRKGYTTSVAGMDSLGQCSYCKHPLAIA